MFETTHELRNNHETVTKSAVRAMYGNRVTDRRTDCPLCVSVA